MKNNFNITQQIEKIKNLYNNISMFIYIIENNILLSSESITDIELQNNIKYIFFKAKKNIYSRYISRLYFILTYIQTETNDNYMKYYEVFINIIDKNVIILPIIDTTINTIKEYIEFINTNNNLNKLSFLNISLLSNYKVDLKNDFSITYDEIHKIKKWKNLIRKNYIIIRKQINNFQLIYFYISQLILNLNDKNIDDLVSKLNNWIILIQSKDIINIIEDIIINLDMIRSVSTYIYDILNGDSDNILLFPNPTSSFIRLKNLDVDQIFILNIYGGIYPNIQFSKVGRDIVINCAILPMGDYTIKLMSKNMYIGTKKFIKF
jgi:hypothetical protein